MVGCKPRARRLRTFSAASEAGFLGQTRANALGRRVVYAPQRRHHRTPLVTSIECEGWHCPTTCPLQSSANRRLKPAAPQASRRQMLQNLRPLAPETITWSWTWSSAVTADEPPRRRFLTPTAN